MMLDQNKRALLIEAVIASGLIAIGIPTGTVPLAVIAAAATSVGGNWAYSLAARGFQDWCAGWFTDNGVLNHDIEKVLYQAYVKAVKQLEQDWKPQYQWLQSKDKEEAEATVHALRRLREDGAHLLLQLEQLTQIAQKEQYAPQAQQESGLSFLYHDDSRASEYLKQAVREYLNGSNEILITFVAERLGPEWTLRFVEILKDPDNKEGTRAWRACQLLWQKSLMSGIEQIQHTTAETADAVHWLQEWAKELRSQPLIHRNHVGQEALEKILYSVRTQLDKMQQTLDKNYAATLEILEKHTKLEQMYQQKVAPDEIALSQVWNVPNRLNPFFTGRETLLADLHDRLSTSKVAALTQAQAISGLGGIGKTQIAVEYAYRYRDEYHDVLWIVAATRETLIASFLELARLLNLPEKDVLESEITRQAVKRWLDQHDRWLLIVDNADDLAIVEEFLPTGGKGNILLTTRAQALGSLANGIPVERMDTEEGMLLVLRRAKVLGEGALLAQAPTEDRVAAETIVKEMDGLPLALDQAGAYIEETRCSVSEYLASYRQRQAELLKRRGQTGQDYPESVATTWSLSFEQVEQLIPMAADLLRVCAFLAPDAIPEELFIKGASVLGPGIQPLTTDATRLNDALGVLLHYSLVKRDMQKRILSIHRLVQVALKEPMDKQTQRQWEDRIVRAINQLRRSSENFLSLPSEVISQIASEEFRHYSKTQAKRSATKKRLLVFIGCGDLTKFIIDNINSSSSRTAADNSIVTVGIDTKFTVGSSHADYFLWLDTNQGLWDDEALIDLLNNLLPKPVAQSLHPGFAPMDLVPVVIGEYHGFNVKTVFEAAEKLGYQVMPDKNTAIRAMDKVEFWQTYHNHPFFRKHLLYQEEVKIPSWAVETLLSNKADSLPGDVEQFMQGAGQKVLNIGLPCMLKPAISEFGYGQVKLEDLADIVPAFKVVTKQCDARKVNPGNRVAIEPFAERKVIDRLAKGRPVELLQTVLRHLNRDGKLVSTCLPPLWFVNYQARTYGSTDLVAGPQVFDFAIQAPATALPELLSTAQYKKIQEKSIQLIESMTEASGLFGLEIFLMSNGEFKFNRLSVRTQDTMFATLPTPQTNAYALLAKVIQHERIDESQLLRQTCISGVKTIVWEGDETGRIRDFEGKKDAEEVENVCKVDLYTERRELRPLRRYGFIQVCVLIEANIGADDVQSALDQVRTSMEEARKRIKFVADFDP